MSNRAEQFGHLQYLARAAKDAAADNYGAVRAVDLENLFFTVLEDYVKGKVTEKRYEAFEDYCLKATVDERIDEGLRLARAVAS